MCYWKDKIIKCEINKTYGNCIRIKKIKTGENYAETIIAMSENVSTSSTAKPAQLTQKHLGMFLDTKLDFQGHLKSIFNKVNKTIGLLRKLHSTLPRLPLLSIYKSFIRPHLDYGDIIYAQAYNVSFHQKLESIQYNSVTVTVSRYNTRNNNNISQFKWKHNFFRNSFFPSAVIEWNKLDLNIHNSESLNVFKNSLLKFIRPSGNGVFNCHNPRGAKLLTRLRLGLSHFLEHKFKHGFQDSLNPICSCGNRNFNSFPPSLSLLFQWKINFPEYYKKH